MNASRRRCDHGVVPFDRARLEGAVGSLVGAAVLLGSAVVSELITFGGDGIFAASVRSRCGADGERSNNSAMSSCEKEPTRRFGLLTGDVGGGGGGLFEFSWRRRWVKESLVNFASVAPMSFSASAMKTPGTNPALGGNLTRDCQDAKKKVCYMMAASRSIVR